MKLQRMNYIENNVSREVACIVGDLHGGEFTLCGNDAVCDVKSGKYAEIYDGGPIGLPYDGKLKDVTCKDCLGHIAFVRGLK